MSAEGKLYLCHFLGKSALFYTAFDFTQNIIGKGTLDRLPVDYPEIKSSDLHIFTPPQFTQYEGNGLVISGQVNLKILGEFINFIICPDVQGFIFGLPGQHLIKIREITGLLTQQFKHHRKIEYKTIITRGTTGN